MLRLRTLESDRGCRGKKRGLRRFADKQRFGAAGAPGLAADTAECNACVRDAAVRGKRYADGGA